MAGRGTDIKLGGDAESFATKVAVKGTPEYEDVYRAYVKECEEDKKKSDSSWWIIYFRNRKT